jgi:hypothetical protein
MNRPRFAAASCNVWSLFSYTSPRFKVLKKRSALALSEGLPAADGFRESVRLRGIVGRKPGDRILPA